MLSVKYDTNEVNSANFGGPAKEALLLLGDNVLYNPNRYSKRCCGDDKCNGKEPRCSLPVVAGGAPSEESCWRASYRWHLAKHRKMLRIVEFGHLGPGQEIEQKMAIDVGGVEVRVIHVSSELLLRTKSLSSPLETRKAHMALAEHMKHLLLKAGFAFKDDESPTSIPDPAPEAAPNESALKAMTVTQLRAKCAELGVSEKGSKAALIKHILEPKDSKVQSPPSNKRKASGQCDELLNPISKASLGEHKREPCPGPWVAWPLDTEDNLRSNAEQTKEAIRLGDVELFREAYAADPDFVINNPTAFRDAVEAGHLDIVEVLASDANMDPLFGVTNWTGSTVLPYVSKLKPEHPLRKCVEECFTKYPHKPKELVRDAIHYENWAVFQSCYSADPDFVIHNPSAFRDAVERACPVPCTTVVGRVCQEMVQVLAADPKLNPLFGMCDVVGSSPLYYIRRLPADDPLRLCVERAFIDCPEKPQRVVMDSVRYGCMSLFQECYAADPDFVVNNPVAYYAAVEAGHLDIVKVLAADPKLNPSVTARMMFF